MVKTIPTPPPETSHTRDRIVNALEMATCDGEYYTQHQIEQAINELPATGGVVFVPEGTWEMDGTTLTLDNHVHLRGASKWRTILNWDDATAADGITIGVDGALQARSSISNMTLDASQSKTGHAISVPTSAWTDFRDLWINDWGGDGIHVDGTATAAIYGRILDCDIEKCETGIDMTNDCRVWSIERCQVNECYAAAYPATTGTGIDLHSCYLVSVLGCSLETLGNGVYQTGTRNCHVKDTYFESISTAPVQVTNNSTGSEILSNWGTIVSLCVVLNNALFSRVEGNDFRSVYGAGFTINNSLEGTVAMHNHAQTAAFNNVPWDDAGMTTPPAYMEQIRSGTGAPTEPVTDYGRIIFSPATTQSITAVGDTVLHGCRVQPFTADGAYTMTSTPTIATGTDGEIITLVNVGANTVTFQDEASLGNTDLELGAATRAVAQFGTLTLLYNSTLDKWVEVGYFGG